MTNEQMLLMILNGAKIPDGMTFHPQNNEQAYLAYAAGLLTDKDALPEPMTMEQALLLYHCLNCGGGALAEALDMVTTAFDSTVYDALEYDECASFVKGEDHNRDAIFVCTAANGGVVYGIIR